MPSILFMLLTCLSLAGQDTIGVQQREKGEFGEKLIDKLNFPQKMELFSMIASSKSKCDLLVFDDSNIRAHAGKTIRSVTISVLDPFDHVDPEDLKKPKFFDLANKLHRTSSERMIEQELLFEAGDPLDVSRIKASQEILYENRYFRDVAILVEQAEEDENFVDVIILVQDLWSWGVWASVGGDHVGGSLVFNKFAGLPQTVIGGLKFNFDRDNPVTPSLIYHYDNIKGSFVSIAGSWMHDKKNFNYQGSVMRGFFSSVPQWAGGIRAGWQRTYYADYDDHSIHNQQDLWLARSFPLEIMDKENMNLILAGRVVRTDFTTTPVRPTAEGNAYPFINSNSYFFAMGAASRRHVQESNIFDFFPYRNLPSGFNMHLIGGLNYNDRHSTRGYAGMTANHALMTCAGYFQEEFGAGGYINNGLEQVTLSIKSKYFTHKFPLKNWGLRQYVYQSLVYGIQRPDGEDVVISNGGIKGIRFNEFKGSSYYTINLETEIYSPIRFAGFQARIFAFADLGLQGNRSNIPLSSPRVYQAYGMGFRLNNWKLGLAFLEFAFVYYPNTAGLYNGHFEFSQNFYNSKVIERNNLYNWDALGPVN